MAEKNDEKAFWKGYSDSNREMKDPPEFIDTLFGGGKVRWDPPSEEKEAYKAGWDHARKEEKSKR
jgi:hypothetical protein